MNSCRSHVPVAGKLRAGCGHRDEAWLCLWENLERRPSAYRDGFPWFQLQCLHFVRWSLRLPLERYSGQNIKFRKTHDEGQTAEVLREHYSMGFYIWDFLWRGEKLKGSVEKLGGTVVDGRIDKALGGTLVTMNRGYTKFRVIKWMKELGACFLCVDQDRYKAQHPFVALWNLKPKRKETEDSEGRSGERDPTLF